MTQRYPSKFAKKIGFYRQLYVRGEGTAVFRHGEVMCPFELIYSSEHNLRLLLYLSYENRTQLWSRHDMLPGYIVFTLDPIELIGFSGRTTKGGTIYISGLKSEAVSATKQDSSMPLEFELSPSKTVEIVYPSAQSHPLLPKSQYLRNYLLSDNSSVQYLEEEFQLGNYGSITVKRLHEDIDADHYRYRHYISVDSSVLGTLPWSNWDIAEFFAAVISFARGSDVRTIAEFACRGSDYVATWRRRFHVQPVKSTYPLFDPAELADQTHDLVDAAFRTLQEREASNDDVVRYTYFLRDYVRMLNNVTHYVDQARLAICEAEAVTRYVRKQRGDTLRERDSTRYKLEKLFLMTNYMPTIEDLDSRITAFKDYRTYVVHEGTMMPDVDPDKPDAENLRRLLAILDMHRHVLLAMLGFNGPFLDLTTVDITLV